MAERKPGMEWLHVVVHVVLTVRAGIGLLLVLIDGRQADPGAVMSAVVALTAMTLYLGSPLRWERATSSLVMPTLDSLLAVVVLMSFGTGGWALGYVSATVFLWALIDRKTPWVVAMVGPLTVYLVLCLADLLLGQVTEGLASAARIVVLCLAAAAAARTRSLLSTYRSMELILREERLRAAQAEERTRLSVEMHDSVAKSLHGIHLMSAHLAARLEAEGHPALEQMVVLKESVDQARAEARHLVANRREVPDDEPHRVLGEMVAAWAASHPDFRVVTSVEPFGLGPGAAHEVLNAVGELLENVARHAEARVVSVQSREEAGWVTIVVSDDGVGMSTTRSEEWVARGHFGVDGVARRMARARGRMQIESRPGAGTTVVLKCPAHVSDRAATPLTARERV
ncbi:MAG: histidine kinase [Ornithinimicrobium sp.]|uniref:sensor histidine kinase n=1 Tax=Ornithinimicrobium sp. TaxID=1977084 RepID=UPI0026DEBF00|nr:ATP-binding protein [Ornithinimicrobium sp.]MDO5740448.1 histidine kinase [Ornithinimicrobium sp.]